MTKCKENSGSSATLTEFLLVQHNKAAPPDGRVEISYDMELVNILEVNELKQRITVLLYIEEVKHIMCVFIFVVLVIDGSAPSSQNED